MPIRTEYRALYEAPGWQLAREAVRARAMDRCEYCHKPNGSTYLAGAEALNLDGSESRRTVVVQCGAAHIDHDDITRFYDPANLLWLCRRDHLAFDKLYHRLSFHHRVALQKFVAALTPPAAAAAGSVLFAPVARSASL